MFGHSEDSDSQQGAPAPTDNNLGGGAPVTQDSPMNDTAGDYIATDIPTPPAVPVPPVPSDDDSDDPADDAPAAPSAPVGNDELLDLKQQALSKLSPLVGHLDQTPEEKFRTTMMMIQASDNDQLIKTAYEAALQISDEKVRAQALLDVVNEINYFTQQHES